MQGMPNVREKLKRLLLGRTNFPQQVTLGLQEPQRAVDVYLYGAGHPLDVTQCHMMACGAPLTICIGLSEEVAECIPGATLALRFFGHGSASMLGEIGLRYVSIITAGKQK